MPKGFWQKQKIKIKIILTRSPFSPEIPSLPYAPLSPFSPGAPG